MKLGKKIVAAVLAAATALTALTVSAFAVDPIGTNPTTLKDGVETTELIQYSDVGFKLYWGFNSSAAFDNCRNYKDFTFTASASGKMKITYNMACDQTLIVCYRASDMAKINPTSHIAKSGSVNKNDYAIWDGTACVFSGEKVYPVDKGDYIIRVMRGLTTDKYKVFGDEGNGRLHITAEMVKPEAPQGIEVTDKTDTSAKLKWTEPDDAVSYDLRYKASGASQWTTVTDIMDNNYTIKKLKGATKYTYQMRSKTAGGLAGEWSKSASFKTNDPKNVKFDVPKVNTSVAVHITWGAVKNATGYKFQYSTDKKNWKTITVEDPAVDMPVKPGKTYYYKVAAKNSAKTGSFSKVYSIKIG